MVIEPGTVNPGTRTLQDTTEQAALTNMAEFAATVREHGGQLVGDPVREPAADARGRYGFRLPTIDGTVVHVLMPGVDLTQIRDDISAQAPCLYIGDDAWWWSDAITQATGPTR